LSEQRVGGFDAVVVEADDAKELSEWLNHYGYVADPELTTWLEPYVKNNWKITAFKIVQDPKTGKPVKTAPVRMSFQTEKPFFPYREGQAKQLTDPPLRKSFDRLLRIFFISDQKVEGRLGEYSWNAQIFWSDRLENGQIKKLAKELGFNENNSIPTGAWLTTFHDTSWSRPENTDVYFESSADQKSIRPANIVHPIYLPVELLLFGGILLLMCFRRIQKRRASVLAGNGPHG